MLSVAIPTKNRHEVLIETLRAMLQRIPDADVEFVVSDNTPMSDALGQFIAQMDDPRLRIDSTSEKLTMSGNVERALGLVAGEYVMIMGDDDFLHPLAMPILRKCLQSSPECLIYPRGTYYWPDVEFPSECDFFEKASVQIVSAPTLAVEHLSAQVALGDVIRSGAVYLMDLPGAYHAVVKKAVLDRYKRQLGTFVPGPSPDMAMAVALACTMDKYQRIFFPISIAGASYHSAAGMGRRDAHNASLDNLPTWLPANLKDSWGAELPRVWNGFTIYAHTVKDVCRQFGRPVDLNYEALLTKIIDQDRRDLQYVLRCSAFRDLPWSRRVAILSRGLLSSWNRSFFHYLPAIVRSRLIRRKAFFAIRSHHRDIQSVGACMDLLAGLHGPLLSRERAKP